MWETPETYLDVTDAKLPYWTFGQGPDLVFVHGWPLDSKTWRHAIQELSSSYTCHVFDLPGAGFSQWSDDGDFGIESLGRTVTEVLEQLELSSFGLVGHDSGGSFARLAAAHFPDRLRGIALGNTEIPGHHPWRLSVMLPLVRVSMFEGALRRMMASGWGRRALFHDSIVDTELIERELRDLFIEPLLAHRRRLQGALLLPQFAKVVDFDIVGRAHPEIQAPVHLIWGRRDPYFPWKKAEAMLGEFGGPSTMTILEDAKLLVHEEHPAAFNAQVRSHFEACFGDGRS